MHNPARLNESDQNDLMQLHNQLVELEKLEIRRSKGEISDADFELLCRSKIHESPDLIVLVQDRSLFFVSSGLRGLLGYSLDEMIGSPVSRYIHPDELPKAVENYEKRMSGQEAPIIYDSVLMHKNKSNIPVKMIASLFIYLGRPASFTIIKTTEETE